MRADAALLAGMFLGTCATVFGSWAINSFLLLHFVGESGVSFSNYYAYELSVRFVFFFLVAISVLTVLKVKTIGASISIGLLSLTILLVTTQGWTDQKLSMSEYLETQFFAYSPVLMIIPSYAVAIFAYRKVGSRGQSS